MKKDRNCGMTPYPVYPPYPQMNPNMMAPGMASPMVMPNVAGMQTQYPQTSYQNDNISSNTIEQQMTQLQRQLNNLESRVSKLESSLNTISNTNFNNTQYSSGNYHVV